MNFSLQLKRPFLIHSRFDGIAAVKVLFRWVHLSITDNLNNKQRFQGITGGVTWPEGDWWVKQTKTIPVEGQKVWSNGAIQVSDLLSCNCHMSFQIVYYPQMLMEQSYFSCLTSCQQHLAKTTIGSEPSSRHNIFPWLYTWRLSFIQSWMKQCSG